MKSILVVAVLAFGLVANATSPYYGPYVAKVVGGKTVCRLIPGENLNSNYLESLIRSAQNSPLVRVGMHMAVTATVPAREIVAGVSPSISRFTLYRDSSAIQKRRGPDAQTLINLVNVHCSKQQ